MKQFFYHKNFIFLFLILLIPELFAGYFSLTPLLTTTILIAGVAFFTLAIFSGCLFNKHRNRLAAVLMITITSSLFFIFNMLELVCYYLMGESFNFGFFYHLNGAALTAESLGGYTVQIVIFIGTIVLAMLLFFINSRQLVKRKYYHKSVEQKQSKWGRFSYKLLFTVLFCGAFVYSEASPVKFYKVYRQMYDKGIIKYDAKKMQKYNFPVDFIKNDDVVIKKNKRKNLVFIFLEGFDSAFLNQKLYPNLTPNLNKLINDSTDNIKVTNFTNITQAPNAYFTIAGIYSALMGAVFTRLHIAFSDRKLIDDEYSNRVHNSGFTNTIATEFSSVPRILNKAGYYQVFLQSASLEFAGTNVFAKSQKFDEALCAKDFKEPTMDKAEWGIFDKDLFKVAFKKYLKFSSGSKPFNLMLTTSDTHDPGFASPSALRYRIPNDFDFRNCSKKMLDAIHDSDNEVTKFIRLLTKTDEIENTVLVLVSDHCVRGASFRKNHLQKNVGGMTFMVLEFGTEGDKNVSTAGATFDVGPTVLDLLGVESNYVFPIGQSLLSNKINSARLKWSSEKERIWESFCRHYSKDLAGKIFELAVCDTPYIHIKINNKLEVPVFVNNLSKLRLPKKNQLFLIEMASNNKIIVKKNILRKAFDSKVVLTNNVNKFIILVNAKLAKNKKLIPKDDKQQGYALLFINKGQIYYKIMPREKINDLVLKL